MALPIRKINYDLLRQGYDIHVNGGFDAYPVHAREVNQIIDQINELFSEESSEELLSLGLTAFAGGGQASGTNLLQGFNVFTVVATTADSAKLPSLAALCAAALPASPVDVQDVIVVNTSANSMRVFPFSGESISALSVNTGIDIPAGTSLEFKKVSCIKWQAFGASQSLPPASSIGYAEYVQTTQGTNSSVAPGTAIAYLVDNPAGVYNTIGITTNTGPGAVGTEFVLPIGTYVIDFENSSDAAWSLALYKSLTTQTEAVDNNTIAGSSTATTWIHGRCILVCAAITYVIVSPVTGTHAIPTAGTAAGEYVARITFLKIA
jgi:hypothetical protein